MNQFIYLYEKYDKIDRAIDDAWREFKNITISLNLDSSIIFDEIRSRVSVYFDDSSQEYCDIIYCIDTTQESENTIAEFFKLLEETQAFSYYSYYYAKYLTDMIELCLKGEE